MLNNRMKAFALFAVFLMMAVAVVPFDSDESDGYPSGYYSVTVSFTDRTITGVTIDGVAAIAATASSDGSWGFDLYGFGPFNSFYAAVSTSDGSVVAPLNPYDLSETVSGVSVDITSGAYNVFWVLPTVYWSTTTTSYTLTNDPNAGGIAYAHTIDGVVKPYVGYAVNEGVVRNGKLLSVSGSVPTASTTRQAFETAAYANNSASAEGDYMLWNFPQWTLAKMCTYAVIGSFNSDVFARGNVDGAWGDGVTANHASVTGLGDSGGPYCASINTSGTDSYAKIFIENLFGSLWEFEGDVSFHDRTIFYGQNSDGSWAHSAYSSDWDSNSSVRGAYTVPATGWVSEYYTDAAVFDLPKTTTSTETVDYFWSNSGDRCAFSGGSWHSGSKVGVSCFSSNSGLATSKAYFGARLAYVFSDAGAASEDTLTWDSVVPTGNYLVGTAINWPVQLSVQNCTVRLNGAPDWLAYQNGAIMGSVANSYADITNVTFTVTVTSPCGQILTQPISVTVEPVLKFTSKPTASCIVIPEISYHDDGSVDAAIIDDFKKSMISSRTGNTFRFVFIGSFAENVVWDFGDGKVGEGNSVVHEYAEAGTFTVTCKAVNSEGEDECSVEVTVDPDYSDYILFGVFLLLAIAAAFLVFKLRRMNSCRR